MFICAHALLTDICSINLEVRLIKTFKITQEIIKIVKQARAKIKLGFSMHCNATVYACLPEHSISGTC